MLHEHQKEFFPSKSIDGLIEVLLYINKDKSVVTFPVSKTTVFRRVV